MGRFHGWGVPWFLLCAHCMQDSGQMSIELYTTHQSDYGHVSISALSVRLAGSSKFLKYIVITGLPIPH
jgi:hypothetical protein